MRKAAASEYGAENRSSGVARRLVHLGEPDACSRVPRGEPDSLAPIDRRCAESASSGFPRER